VIVPVVCVIEVTRGVRLAHPLMGWRTTVRLTRRSVVPIVTFAISCCAVPTGAGDSASNEEFEGRFLSV
jgi:hypothetical protein